MFAVSLTFCLAQSTLSQEAVLSAESEECLVCHADTHPGLIASWQKGLHSRTTPDQALQKGELERRVSSTDIDSSLLSVAVGCYECHSLNTERHKDAFEHNGYTINVIVSPDDCATCHAVEADQYSRNLMSQAHANLVENGLYQTLMKSVNNPHSYAEDGLTIGGTDTLTSYESCLYCHGTRVEVKGFITKETDLGEFQFPVLEGWPNQGVGRINPDGSKGACTACHTRHDFSIETARKPYTCSECHKGPDVPAFKVYEASKHGNIFKSKAHEYEFNAVPWTVGKDFTAPTCATCHVSLVVAPDETVIMERTHQFNDRLAWRLFGVPYAYPHPAKADLRGVKNSQGLPLAVELNGEPVAEFVISKEEQHARDARMKTICLSCHNSEWVDNHFIRLDNTIQKTNEITHEATKIMMDIWNGGYAEGLPQGKNIFDEDPERVWTTLWLFHTNSTRFASAMAGGGDYGVFANGRYQTTGQLYKLLEKLHTYKGMKGK
jgi:hypothetical protein